jgi:hypothetical protein
MTDLPEPDPAAGELANEEVSQARRDAEQALSEGKMGLQALFSQVDQEREEGGHRVYGHMHVKAALMALPKIDEVKATDIITDLGWDGTTRLDQVGDQQREVLYELVIDETT